MRLSTFCGLHRDTEHLLPLQITETVSSGKCWKIISHGYAWAAGSYQSLAAGTAWISISHIYQPKPVNPVVSNLKSKFPKKYQCFNV
jgi:hypothetical protein